MHTCMHASVVLQVNSQGMVALALLRAYPPQPPPPLTHPLQQTPPSPHCPFSIRPHACTHHDTAAAPRRLAPWPLVEHTVRAASDESRKGLRAMQGSRSWWAAHRCTHSSYSNNLRSSSSRWGKNGFSSSSSSRPAAVCKQAVLAKAVVPKPKTCATAAHRPVHTAGAGAAAA